MRKETWPELCVLRMISRNKQAEEALRKAHDELEVRVIERTSELAKTTEELETEIVEREKLERALVEQHFQGSTTYFLRFAISLAVDT